MSKKSRRRNKRLLALAGLAGAVALSRRNKLANATETNNPVGGVDQIAADAKKDSPKKDTVVKTPTTIQDNKPIKISKNSIAKRSSRGAGDYVDYKPASKRVNGVLIKSRNNADMGRNTPFDPAQGNSQKTMKEALSGGDARGYAGTVNYRKDGGRAGLKSGGKVKGCGIAKRGLGRAMKKGKR
jgi:hypothetical protein